MQRRLEVSEIITLHQQGVSDTLISAMQSAPLASQLSGNAAYQSPPAVARVPSVIVQEPVIYRSPVVVERVYRPYRVHHYHRPYPGASIRVGF